MNKIAQEKFEHNLFEIDAGLSLLLTQRSDTRIVTDNYLFSSEWSHVFLSATFASTQRPHWVNISKLSNSFEFIFHSVFCLGYSVAVIVVLHAFRMPSKPSTSRRVLFIFFHILECEEITDGDKLVRELGTQSRSRTRWRIYFFFLFIPF